MPNVMEGLKKCANVSKRGCKGCPFRGATYCTSMLAQGAETMIKDLKENNKTLLEKQPLVGAKLKKLIETSAEALKHPSAETQMCKIALSAEDADALSEFLTKALSNSREVFEFDPPRDFPFAFVPDDAGEQQTQRGEREIDREFTEAVEQCLGIIGDARLGMSFLSMCDCPRCVAVRRLNSAWNDFSNRFGAINAEARRDRIVRDFNRSQSSQEQPTTEGEVAAQAIQELTEPERAMAEQTVRNATSAFDSYIRRQLNRFRERRDVGIRPTEQLTSDPTSVQFRRYVPLPNVEAQPDAQSNADGLACSAYTIDEVSTSDESASDIPARIPW